MSPSKNSSSSTHHLNNTVYNGYLTSCSPHLRGERDDPLMNDLPPTKANEGNINLSNISYC